MYALKHFDDLSSFQAIQLYRPKIFYSDLEKNIAFNARQINIVSLFCLDRLWKLITSCKLKYFKESPERDFSTCISLKPYIKYLFPVRYANSSPLLPFL